MHGALIDMMSLSFVCAVEPESQAVQCVIAKSLVTGLVKFSHCFHFARTLYSRSCRCLYYVRLTCICHKKTRHTTTTLNTRPFKSNYIKLNFARNVTKYYIYNFKFLAFVRILFFVGLIIILLQKWKITYSSLKSSSHAVHDIVII